MKPSYEYAVIGKGLVGAAAARYVSQLSDRVVLIGQDEPQNLKEHLGVFASHYDSGRITRQLDPSPLWSELAMRAITQYRLIERESGLSFYHPTSCVYAGPAEYVQGYADVGDQHRLAYTHREADADLGGLHFEGMAVLHEPTPAGYINPRQMVKAQMMIAQQHGVTVVYDWATRCDIATDGEGVIVETHCKEQIYAKKVLLATGPHSNHLPLLPQPLALMPEAHTIIYARLSEAEAARLQAMPSAIIEAGQGSIQSYYLVPPTRYPDGKMYLKLGGHDDHDAPLPNLADARAWMRYETEAPTGRLAALREALHTFIPSLRAESYSLGHCMITRTAHKNPYIDEVVPGKVYVAVGGNGSLAKSADAVGSLGVQLMHTESWLDGLPRDAFRVVYGSWTAG